MASQNTTPAPAPAVTFAIGESLLFRFLDRAPKEVHGVPFRDAVESAAVDVPIVPRGRGRAYELTLDPQLASLLAGYFAQAMADGNSGLGSTRGLARAYRAITEAM